MELHNGNYRACIEGLTMISRTPYHHASASTFGGMDESRNGEINRVDGGES